MSYDLAVCVACNGPVLPRALRCRHCGARLDLNWATVVVHVDVRYEQAGAVYQVWTTYSIDDDEPTAGIEPATSRLRNGRSTD